ncbi:MAG: ABC transporter substrate-binding protein [Desulfobacteraceae bacterium 4572_130]|nr:MAG: ABC transporter substrate-binding protein [Desulfobacteraceae bacterium 4572_130]
MKIKELVYYVLMLLIIFLWGCPNNENNSFNKEKKQKSSLKKTTANKKITAILPKDIKWLTNDFDPVFSSQNALKGGTCHLSILSFPMTFRTIGPDSNGSFRSAILDNHLSLTNIHPNTGNIIPELATHWAFDKDKKTMYFKLNKNAKWSDGVPVRASDFAYTLEFMRSPYIIAPWYNDYYSKEIEKIIIYDNYTLAVKSTKPDPDLYLKIAIPPTPEHFFGKLNKNFIHKYNWSIVPNTGAYQISDYKKGKFIKFKRKKDWWAKDLKIFKNRFNVDLVIFNVIRDFNMLWEYFKKGKIDIFPLVMPQYWHNRSNTDVFNKGYVKKIWFFNDTQRSASGMWLNQDKEIFSDKRVRYAFSHGMNIKKIIKKVLRDDYFRLNQAYVGYGDYTNLNIKAREFSIVKVEKLMKEAGWKRGVSGIWQKNEKLFSIEVTYAFEGHTPRLVVLKEEAQKAGIELRLQKLDSTTAFKKFLEKKHEVAWMGWSTNLRPSYWQSWHSDNAHLTQTNNITNTDDSVIDKLINKYRASLSQDQRKKLSLKIQKKIHETGNFVPTFMVPYVRHGYWRWIRLPEFHGTKKSNSLFDPFNAMTGGLFWFDRKLYNKTRDFMKKNKSFKPVTIINDNFKLGTEKGTKESH